MSALGGKHVAFMCFRCGYKNSHLGRSQAVVINFAIPAPQNRPHCVTFRFAANTEPACWDQGRPRSRPAADCAHARELPNRPAAPGRSDRRQKTHDVPFSGWSDRLTSENCHRLSPVRRARHQSSSVPLQRVLSVVACRALPSISESPAPLNRLPIGYVVAELSAERPSEPLLLASAVVRAFVTKNTVSASDLPKLIALVHQAFADLRAPAAPAEVEAAKPAVSVRKVHYAGLPDLS